MKKETLLGIPVHGPALDEAVAAALHYLHGTEQRIIHTANANVLVLAQKDELLRQSFLTADLLLPDGQGAVLGSQWFGKGNIRHKVAGPDFFDAFVQTLGKTNKKHSFFFLGSTKQTLAKIKNELEQRYPSIAFASYAPPFRETFTEHDTTKMIAAVNKAKPDVLWVGMTAPKQEKWIEQHKHKLKAKLIVTVGAAFDYFAGNTRRCPKWLARLLGNTEFVYRFFLSPKRMFARTIRSAIVYPSLLLAQKIRTWKQ